MKETVKRQKTDKERTWREKDIGLSDGGRGLLVLTVTIRIDSQG